ncbi:MULTISPECIES: SDR family oxidoreductase [unclassified Microbispora]|uniref:SDR family oxidoreductase n=1 Tax=Microbispora sp. CL1-1 TaxID=2720026 RepID=UPI001F0F8676|nr:MULTISPECIES: SDR family oxidoreductase [unclassified Microbispora]
MQADEARRANVDSVRSVVVFAARLPRLRRLVHVSGYRVGGQDPRPWSEERRRETYRALGAYEASKVEADAVYRFEAERLGVPWSVVNPASVIGDSVTGEAGQYLGLASTLRDLWRGGLPVVPGNARTFELGEPGAPTVVLRACRSTPTPGRRSSRLWAKPARPTCRAWG